VADGIHGLDAEAGGTARHDRSLLRIGTPEVVVTAP
jgi:hypothetical protein